MFCGFDTIEGYGARDIRGTPMNCKRWSCPHCQPIRCAQLRELASSGNPTVFITLTASDACGDDPDAIARDLVRAWRDVIQRGKREGLWHKPQYLAVFEETKRHRPHLHILWRGPCIPHAWLSERMDQYISSPIVYLERVRSANRAARYVSKYVSKAPWRWQGTKRYWRSMHWRQHSAVSPADAAKDARWWRRIQVMAHNRVQQLEAAGYAIIADADGSYTAIPAGARAGPPRPPAP